MSKQETKPSEQPAAQPGSSSEPHLQLVGLKTGDYLVHVFIEETRGLRHPKSSDSTVNPIIEIKAFGKKRYSKVQKGVGSGATFWGDHYYFEKSFDTTIALESEKITITVSDHNTFGFNGVIGTVELNIPTVYYKENHCLEYQWAALAGLTKKYQDVLGFIKFSVGVFATGDEQRILKEEKLLDAGAGPNKVNVLYPPQIVTEPYQIRIRVFRGEKLKKMDTFGKTDPYVKALYGGLEVVTTTIKVTLDPVWNEELRLPASLPTINEKLVLKLYDWESGLQTDEHMGSLTFDIKDLMNNKYSQPFWVNVYGSPTGAKNPFEKMMNDVPELGTEWKGKLQLAITMKPEDKPVVGMHPIKEAPIVKAAETYKKEVYELRAEIQYAMNLRKDGEDYTIKVRWGPNEAVTKKKTSKDRMIEVYESLLITSELPAGGKLEDIEIPDVFVYISNSDKNLSFMRSPWQAFRKIDAKLGVYYFIVDRSVTTTREDLAGIVKMRILISKPSEKPNLSMYGWDRPILKHAPKDAWKLHCNIYQAKELISGDVTGLSDPYLNIYFFGSEQKTSVIPQTVNPIWNERLEFKASFDSLDEAPPLFITVWDQDPSSEDFIGSTIYNLKEEDLNPEELPKPKWLNIKYGKGGATQGKILLSVCCYNRPELIPRSPYINPETTKYFINMKVLGLRQLESIGLLPVRRAFVRFDVDSVRGKEQKSHLPEKKFLKTEPLNPGPDPNILTVINLEVDLPTDPDFCPSMSCAVFDYIFKGMSQPLIGNFSLPLGDFLRDTTKELESRIDKLTRLFESTQRIQKLKEEQSQRESQLAIEPEKIFDQTQLEETEIRESPAIAPSEQKPLLGRFTGGLIERFASIKKKKGILPGESGDVKIDIFEHLTPELSGLPDPLQDVCEENKISQDFVIYSKIVDGHEVDKPDPTKYIELGHNSKHDHENKKHYRYYLNSELEKSDFIDATPFVSIPIYRGKKVAEEGVLANLLRRGDDYRCVGYFKTMVTVMSEIDKIRFDSKIQHVGKYARTAGLEFSDDEFLRRKDVIVRVYVVKAEGLADKDDDSNSDPYIVVKFGNTEYNERKNYHKDNPNPEFYQCFEFTSTLPGASKLSIELWDYDHLDADDLIGKTVIDVEDRWYSPKWRSLRHIPIETRSLYHPSSSVSQGAVKLWIEILPKDLPRSPIMNIRPKDHLHYELRVIVWQCKDVPNVDFEDAVDIYITGKLSDGQEQRTDTHFRAQNGHGHFNWRMVFPVMIPMKKHRISFQIWDKDILSANDYISEATFDFDLEAAKAFETEETVDILGPSGRDRKFWIPCSSNKMVRGKAVPETVGSIEISMALVPKHHAEQVPVGLGRSKPNQHPFLEPPEGRFELTWNIKKLYHQLVGPLARRKILIWTCIIFCIFIIIMLFPIVMADLITAPIENAV